METNIPISQIFDSSSIYWTKNKMHNRIFLQAQEEYFNHMLRVRGHVFLNEVYDALGFFRTPEGQRLGWLYEKDAYISFGLKADQDEDSYELVFNVHEEIWDKI